MKVVILAGGKGTRIREKSQLIPKPMIEIGGMPILWHIMKTYSHYGYNEFIICCGYKGEYIKEYFLDYSLKNKNVLFDLEKTDKNMPKTTFFNEVENWKISFINTGLNTNTSGRLLRVRQYLQDDDEFMLTYGDGVSDIDITQLIEFHKKSGKIATISTTRPDGRFGVVKVNDGIVNGFKEKARQDQSLVNIGFMILNKEIFSYLGDGSSMLEQEPFEKLSLDEKMAAYYHDGFWSPMDNMSDHEYLEKLWENNAPWRVW